MEPHSVPRCWRLSSLAGPDVWILPQDQPEGWSMHTLQTFALRNSRSYETSTPFECRSHLRHDLQSSVCLSAAATANQQLVIMLPQQLETASQQLVAQPAASIQQLSSQQWSANSQASDDGGGVATISHKGSPGLVPSGSCPRVFC